MKAAPFVVGMMRSGTTLLRLMLDAHPELAIPSETFFVPRVAYNGEGRPAETVEGFLDALTESPTWEAHGVSRADLSARLRKLPAFGPGEALRIFYRLYAGALGKTRWGDKTPAYVNHMERIQGLLPEARFVHVMRDGRDVALSFIGLQREFGVEKHLREVARRWAGTIRLAREQSRRLAGYLEVRYEDLVRDPEPVLGEVCRFLDLPWNPAMLRYFEGAEGRLRELDFLQRAAEAGKAAIARQVRRNLASVRRPPDETCIGRWRKGLDARQQEVFLQEAGEVLAELGYRER